MNRLWTTVSVRVFAVFILVVGLVAGAWLGVRNTSSPDTTQASQYVGEPVDPVENLQKRHEAAEQYRQGQLRADASRRASRSAERKAAAGGEHAAAVAQEADAAKQEAEQKAAAKAKAEKTQSQPAPEVASSCNAYSGNKAIGCTLMLQEGFKIDQMSCLSQLWDRESGWNVHAANPSGAYGIPQALPGSKMSTYGSDWQDNPATQIKWGLHYIEDRYSSPCGAWQHSQNTGWY